MKAIRHWFRVFFNDIIGNIEITTVRKKDGNNGSCPHCKNQGFIEKERIGKYECTQCWRKVNVEEMI